MDNKVFDQLLELFSYEMFFSILTVIFTVMIVLWTLKWGIHTLVNYKPKYRIQLAQTYPVLRIIIWTSSIIFIITGIINPPQTVVYASLGSLGLAVGLASQDAIKNIVAGVIMAFSPRFKVGDMVGVKEHYGEVISLDLNTTRLRTFEDNIVVVPNSNILSMPITNANNGELNELVVVELHLPTTIPIKKLKSVALAAAKCSHYVYLKKPITATLKTRFEESFYYKLVVKAYVIDVRMELAMQTDVTERIIEALQDKHLMTDTTFDVTEYPEKLVS